MLTIKSIIAAVDGQVSSRLADEVVILSLQDGTYYGLNAVGARIWEMVQKPSTIESLVDRLAAEYEVEPDTCRQQVLALAGELAERGLITIDGAA